MSAGILHVELAHILRPRAIRAVGLHIDLPLAAEAVEVIHQRAAHERLQSLVHVGQVDALCQNLGLVDGDVDLRNAVKRRGVQAGQLGTLACGFHEDLKILDQERGAAPRTVLENEAEAAGIADARNGRWGKDEGNAGGELRKGTLQVRLDACVALGRRFAVAPVLQRDEEE